MKEIHLSGDSVAAFPLEYLGKKRWLGDLHRLWVDIDAKKVRSKEYDAARRS